MLHQDFMKGGMAKECEVAVSSAQDVRDQVVRDITEAQAFIAVTYVNGTLHVNAVGDSSLRAAMLLRMLKAELDQISFI